MNLNILLAEFIGTFTLIFIGVGSIAADHLSSGHSGLVGVALAHGLAIAVMVSATAAISGGHLNPAVTLGLLSIKKISLNNAISYVITQCSGAIAAAICLKLCFPAEVISAIGMGTPGPGAGITIGMVFVTEVILTFFLVYVVCGTAVDARAPKMGGLFIGLTVALDILMGGPVSGGAMNPARYMGPAVVSANLSHIWLYWLAPVLGGVLAAQAYHLKLAK